MNEARQLIADVMSPPISGPVAAPMPADRVDRAERPGPRGDLGEQHGGQDVDGRDQQRRADALEDRVADDEHRQAGSDRADQRADAVHREADVETPLAAVAIGQLAARDHERRHDQQEDRDRELHALHGRVQVLADVVDHDVHVRAGEAADELGEREGNQHPAQGARRPSRRDLLGHALPAFTRAGQPGRARAGSLWQSPPSARPTASFAAHDAHRRRLPDAEPHDGLSAHRRPRPHRRSSDRSAGRHRRIDRLVLRAPVRLAQRLRRPARPRTAAGTSGSAPRWTSSPASSCTFPDTAVLVTRFMTEAGVGEVVDFMPVSGDDRHADSHRLVRMVRCVRGQMTFAVDIAPRFDYGREPHETHLTEDGVRLPGPRTAMTVASRPRAGRRAAGPQLGGRERRRARRVHPRRRARCGAWCWRPAAAGPLRQVRVAEARRLFDETVDFWTDWLGQSTYAGRWRESREPLGDHARSS